MPLLIRNFVPAAPLISYAGSPFSWMQGVAIATASPTNTGGTINQTGGYAVTTGSLPTGISLNADTGQLTGTPTADDGDASVGITATGPGGTHEATISVSVFTPADLPAGTRWWDPAAAYCATDGCVEFNGAGNPTGNHLSVASHADLVTGDVNFMVGGWVRLDAHTTAYGYVIAKSASVSTLEYGLRVLGSGSAARWEFWVGNAAGTDIQKVTASAAGEPSDAAWYFVLGWFDSANNKVKIQVNGGTVNEANATAAPYSGTGAVYIGSLFGVTTDLLDGRVQGVFLIKDIPDTDDQAWLYNSDAGRTVSEMTAYWGSSLKGLWPCYEATGNRSDQSGNGHHMAGTNTPSVNIGKVSDVPVNNAPVKTWTDRLQSTAASQATMANQPLWIADIGNGEPGLDGDGGDVLTTTAPATSTHHEIIAAFSLDATHNDYAQAFGHGDDWPRWYACHGSTHKPRAGAVGLGAMWGSVINDGVLRCLRWYVSASAQAMNVNGGTPVTATATMVGSKSTSLKGILGGTYAPQYAAGRVGHSIVYFAASELTAGQRSQTEAWVKAKYGIP